MYAVCKLVERPESIFCKLRKDNKIIHKEIPFKNHFYILDKDFVDVEYLLNKFIEESSIIKDKYGTAYRKLILMNNYHRNIIKKKLEVDFNIQTFEADINSCKRFLVQNQKEELHQDKLEYLFIDIETFDLTPLVKDFNGKIVAVEPILSIACKDMKGEVVYINNKAIEKIPEDLLNQYREYMKDRMNYPIKEKKRITEELRKHLIDGEKELLKAASEVMSKYDVMLAWNGNRFDFPYIEQRMKKHAMKYENMMVHSLDYMEIFKKNSWDSLKSYSLNNVSKHVFRDELKKESSDYDLSEFTKLDWGQLTGLKKFTELYLFEQKMLKEYNIQDVNLMFMMEQQLKFLKIQEVSAKLCHCLINNTIWNSHLCDYLFLNEYHNRNIIKQSKPNNEEIEKRTDPVTGSYPSGGFTRCFLPGYHEKVHAYDFKSMYPCHIISFNISPETFVKNMMPALHLVFDEYEVEFVSRVNVLSKEFLNKAGLLNKKKYDIRIEEIRNEIQNKAMIHKGEYKLRDMTNLMWHFVDKYDNPDIRKECEDNDCIFTPADINFDTRGWKIHPHRIFKKDSGVMKDISLHLLTERDKAKYNKKSAEYHSAAWWAQEFYQLAIKTIGNSLFGYTSFKSSREFSYDIPDTICSVSRSTLKQCINYARKKNYPCVLCDTDSLYIYGLEDTKILEQEYFDFLNKYSKGYGCNAGVKINNPHNDERVVSNHFLVLEHEKMFESMIAVKKKRYYYKLDSKGKWVYDTQGGAFKKTDTIKVSADLQKELVTNILDKKYDKAEWKDKLLKLKTKTYAFKLEKEHIVKTAALSRRIDEYGKPVIDGKTGVQKRRKSDGQPMFAPIPAQIKVAERLIEGGAEIEVGDKIDYIVKNSKPKIEAISLTEYDKENVYDADYYWDRILKPIIEILNVVDPKEIYTYYSDCWNYSEKQLVKLIAKFKEDEEE